MSAAQQPMKKKTPTKWHIMGIGALGGIPWGFFKTSEATLLNLCLPIPIAMMLAILGAAIGVKIAGSVKGKWIGLWIGALIGAPLFARILFFILSNF